MPGRRPRPADRSSARTPGAYVLLFHLEGETTVQVGRLGRLDLGPGTYAYVGSALSGLESRVGRHLRGGGKKHWHIDYLLDRAIDKEAWVLRSEEDIECSVATFLRSVTGVAASVKGFGSSDCRCQTHLFKLDGMTVAELHDRLFACGATPLSWTHA